MAGNKFRSQVVQSLVILVLWLLLNNPISKKHADIIFVYLCCIFPHNILVLLLLRFFFFALVTAKDVKLVLLFWVSLLLRCTVCAFMEGSGWVGMLTASQHPQRGEWAQSCQCLWYGKNPLKVLFCSFNDDSRAKQVSEILQTTYIPFQQLRADRWFSSDQILTSWINKKQNSLVLKYSYFIFIFFGTFRDPNSV